MSNREFKVHPRGVKLSWSAASRAIILSVRDTVTQRQTALRVGEKRYKRGKLPRARIAQRSAVDVNMNWSLCALLFLSLVNRGLGAKDEQKKSPIVKTPLGKIKGTYGLSANGRKYESYQGIPYALPPTGERRFEVNSANNILV